MMLEELNKFCVSNNFETCLKTLKTRLIHQNQMDIYDSLYISICQNNKL